MGLVKRERDIAEHYVLRRLMMEPGFHALSDLFKQLGLPSDNGSVQQFIMEHAPLPDAMRSEDRAMLSACAAGRAAARAVAAGCRLGRSSGPAQRRAAATLIFTACLSVARLFREVA